MKDKVDNSEIIRTYHEVDNRVKDHASGFKQSYTDTMRDISKMIQARRDAIDSTTT